MTQLRRVNCAMMLQPMTPANSAAHAQNIQSQPLRYATTGTPHTRSTATAQVTGCHQRSFSLLFGWNTPTVPYTIHPESR